MSCPGQSSGLLTGDGAITTAQGVLLSVAVTNGVAVIYDNKSAASGTVLAKVTAPATQTVVLYLEDGVSFMNGLYLDITGGEVVVTYRKG